MNQTAVVAYKLPTQWRQSDLLKAVEHYRLLPTADAITVLDTVKTASGTRINLTAAYRSRPVFDRELILTVAKTGEVTHIDNRLIESPAFAESQISDENQTFGSAIRNRLTTSMKIGGTELLPRGSGREKRYASSARAYTDRIGSAIMSNAWL